MQFRKSQPSRRKIFAASLAAVVCSISVASVARAQEAEGPAAFFAKDAERMAARNPASSQAAASKQAAPVMASRQKASRTRVSGSPALHAMVTAAAERHRVPVAIAHSIVRVESGYNCNARSKSGAIGVMQTLTATARGVGVSGPLTDCATSLEAGMRYLRQALDAHGVGCAGLSAYERGIRGSGVCTAYGRKVMAMAAQG